MERWGWIMSELILLRSAVNRRTVCPCPRHRLKHHLGIRVEQLTGRPSDRGRMSVDPPLPPCPGVPAS